MNIDGKNILSKFLKRWQFMLALEAFLYAFGVSVLIYFVSHNLLLSTIAFLITGLTASLLIKPWKPNLKTTSSYLDSKIESVEYSSSLLLSSWEQHSDIAKLQQIKVAKQLEDSIKKINPPNHLLSASITVLIIILAGFLWNQFNTAQYFQSPVDPTLPNNTIIFKTKDSTSLKIDPPKLISQSVTMRYPEYTNIKSLTSSNMDIKVLEGSKVFWKLEFDSEVQQVQMESMGNDYPMTLKDGFYRQSKTLKGSGFYNFKFSDTLGNIYASDLYAITVFKDKSPQVKIQSLKQFTSFQYDDDKRIQFNTSITDDFGISNAYIIATVSKGSGESVKFREEKLLFDSPISKGSKALSLSKHIRLDDLKMAPGDELYFYVEASDFKQPKPNISRSETYFAAIKDTTSYAFGVEGTLGVNRMPDYFRSQRQLIIDTEKLISEKNKLTAKNFKFRSNELGYDQKALRLKYGEFMGVETDSGLDIEQEEPSEIEEEHDDEDPLADYTHDHDGDNEHNLVETEKDKTPKNPLQEFLHDHGDPEMATLFEESLKTKMHKAMAEMWDAELYLRLYEPKKSLPYQYRALKLIQDIKNHARIYVHRIGFDPPPIKEDKRLTGKQLDKITSFSKTQTLAQEDDYLYIKQAISRLEELIIENNISGKDRELFEQAATELSAIAIRFPSQHLKTLQQLKLITEEIDVSEKSLLTVQQGLLESLPKLEANPKKGNQHLNSIEKLLLKELDIYD